VSEQGDRAFVVGFAGVRVDQFMQRRRGRHGVQQQDKTGQQRGDDRLAGWFGLARYEPHSIGKLAHLEPSARVDD